jgi:hypothetical protein
MKKILLTGILLGTVVFAETHVNGLETNTTLVVLDGYESTKFSKKIENQINDSEKIDKNRLESLARIEEAQRAMKEKYKLNLTTKEVSKEDLEASKELQAQNVIQKSKQFLNTYYKDLTPEKCSKFKQAEIYSKAVCKAKNENKIDEALADLESILKMDEKAYCMKQMIDLQKATKDNDVISNSSRNSMLSTDGYKRTLTCNKVFEITSQKVSLK